MTRRASSRLHPAWIVAAVLVGVGTLVVGRLVFSHASDPYRTLQPLNVAGYLDNANSLRGNVYRVTGMVWNSLGWSPTAGRIFAIEAGDERTTELLPVLVPAALNYVNLQKGQRFVFEVEVSEGGVLLVRSLRKS